MFFVDTPYTSVNADTFRQEYLLSERPAIFRGAASLTENGDEVSAFSRCVPLFGDFSKIENVALKEYGDLAAGCPEVASNAFMKCDRGLYADVPVVTVHDALRLLKTTDNNVPHVDIDGSSGSGGGDEGSVRAKVPAQVADTGPRHDQEDAVSYYVKLPLVSSPRILERLKLEQFLLQPERHEPVTWCDHPMLLKPGSCFAWLFAGQRGSSSPSHVDIMGSDAFLACFAGLKEWAMVHPFDKHLVMSADGTQMCDLFEMDFLKFPNARYARVCYFEQRAGDVVFVPGNAPHAVRNLADSISVTFNFLDKATGGPKASQFLAYSMKHRTDAMTELPASFTYRVFSQSSRLDFRLRTPVWGVDWRLPADEWTYRTSAGTQGIHIAAEPIRKVVPRALTALRAVGATVSECEHSADFFFECDSEDQIAELARALNTVEQTAMCATRWPLQPFETVVMPTTTTAATAATAAAADGFDAESKVGFIFRRGNVTPARRFSQLDSHFGRFFAFPPLCSCLGYEWAFEVTRNDDGGASALAAPLPIISLMRKSLAENFGQPILWHYARYPISLPSWSSRAAAASEQNPEQQLPWQEWCKTQLFYSSPCLAGPVSLYPLLADGTLLPQPPLHDGAQEKTETSPPSSPPASSYPHFVQLMWSIDRLMKEVSSGATSPLFVWDFGELLTERLVAQIYMQLSLFQDIAAAAKSLGLERFPADQEGCVNCGFEKILSVVLHLSSKPGIVGFRYSHVFSAVREPETLCLTGSAVSYLTVPILPAKSSPSSSSSSSKANAAMESLCITLTAICRFVKDDASKDRKTEDDIAEAGKIVQHAFELGRSASAASVDEEKKSLQTTIQFCNKILEAVNADIELQRDKLEGDDAVANLQRQHMRSAMVAAALRHFEEAVLSIPAAGDGDE